MLNFNIHTGELFFTSIIFTIFQQLILTSSMPLHVTYRIRVINSINKGNIGLVNLTLLLLIFTINSKVSDINSRLNRVI